MSIVALGCAAVMAAGASLLLGELAPLRREPLLARLRRADLGVPGLLGSSAPYEPHDSPQASSSGLRRNVAAAASFFDAAFGGRSSAKRRARIVDELPIVAEQIGMLLASGLSLTGALTQTSVRGQGVCAAEIGRVVARVEAGASVEAALHAWADSAGVAQIRRFVGVLTLHEDASDIASLVSEEARQSRSDTHRRLLSHIERRNEQVWIPVTVAALVPGAVLLAIPFSDALRGFGAL